jgi:Heavy metal binding domain
MGIGSARRIAAALLVVAALGGGARAALQAPRAGAQDQSVPPLSYTCPMHPEIVEDKKGSCPICRMDLVGIRLDSVWTCATRPLAVIEAKPGRCPIDGTPLVQVTAAVSWTCPGSDQESLAPGTCPDGSPMQKKYAPRAHGNHNPQHGGQFFMAADNWHHLEGTYLPTGVFRLHLYDDFTKPLPLADVRAPRSRFR